MPMNVICLGCGDEMFANVLVCDVCWNGEWDMWWTEINSIKDVLEVDEESRRISNDLINSGIF